MDEDFLFVASIESLILYHILSKLFISDTLPFVLKLPDFYLFQTPLPCHFYK